jgi:hypothetical protein
MNALRTGPGWSSKLDIATDSNAAQDRAITDHCPFTTDEVAKPNLTAVQEQPGLKNVRSR